MTVKNVLTNVEEKEITVITESDNMTISQMLKQIGVKSKKKRIRKKVMKKAVSQLNVFGETISSEVIEPTKAQTTTTDSVESSITQIFENLPITFLLKLGKQYLRNENAVRYYYNQNETTYYKNRTLLQESLQNFMRNTDVNTQMEIIQLVSEQKNKKAKA